MLRRFAGLAVRSRPWERAARLAGAAGAQAAAYGGLKPAELARDEREVQTAHEALGEPAASAALEAGQAMSLEQAIAYALETPDAA